MWYVKDMNYEGTFFYNKKENAVERAFEIFKHDVLSIYGDEEGFKEEEGQTFEEVKKEMLEEEDYWDDSVQLAKVVTED